MKLKPEKWSHHHAHRLFHLSIGLCFAFILVVITMGMAALWWQVGADTTPKSGVMQVTAIVGGINPGPINSESSGPTPVPNQIPTTTINAEPVGQVPQQSTSLNGQNVTAYNFSVSNPAFSGQASMAGALIFITIQGPVNFNSTAIAGNDGNWLWQSPQNLPAGTYTIIATVYNPSDLAKFSTVKAYFTIPVIENVPPNNTGQLPGAGSGSGIEQPGGGKLLFGIFFEVLPEFKKALVGSEVKALITLVSNKTNEEIANQIIEYEVRGVDGKVIMESRDIVSFSGVSRFIKTILTAPATRAGVYTVTVKSSYQGIVSTASDTFVLEDPIPGPYGLERGPIILWSVLAGLLLLFLLLVLMAYHQVRLVTRHIHEHNERWHKEQS